MARVYDARVAQAPDLGFIHRYIPATDSARPPVLLLHGTGADETDLIPLGEMLLPGAALLSPRGKVSEEGLNRFFRRVDEGVWDREDFNARTEELASFVEAARQTYRLERPLVIGFSNGANIGWSLMLRDPDALAGALLMRPMLPFDPRPFPDLMDFRCCSCQARTIRWCRRTSHPISRRFLARPAPKSRSKCCRQNMR